jgi:hypothetical protein
MNFEVPVSQSSLGWRGKYSGKNIRFLDQSPIRLVLLPSTITEKGLRIDRGSGNGTMQATVSRIGGGPPVSLAGEAAAISLTVEP